MKRALMRAAAPPLGFAQETASAPLSGKLSTKAHGDDAANFIGAHGLEFLGPRSHDALLLHFEGEFTMLGTKDIVMIWESILAMALIDIVVGMIALASLTMLYRQRHMLSQSGMLAGAGAVVAGLSAIGLFYAADLFVMWGLPQFIARPRAMAVMMDMHLNYSWVVVLAVVVSVFGGFGLMMPKMFAQTKKLMKEIAERKQTEEKLAALAAELEVKVASRTEELAKALGALTVADRMKSEFMANVTHELRTPLNSVIGFAELLKDEVPGPLNAKQAAFAADIFASGQHLLALVEGILEMSRLDVEGAGFTLEEVDVAAALKDRVAAHREKAGERGVTLRLDDAMDVGSCKVDPGALRRMLDALIDNAITFTGEGSSVAVSARRANGALEIAVADTGIGIAGEDLPKLFKPLTQLDASLARKHGGAGLGLALARRLAELHGGTIEVESRPGEGSTFILRLPVQEQA